MRAPTKSDEVEMSAMKRVPVGLPLADQEAVMEEVMTEKVEVKVRGMLAREAVERMSVYPEAFKRRLAPAEFQRERERM